jgi:circadian clock protein KaiB
MQANTKKSKILFRLYITNRAPTSMRALENLRHICRDYFDGGYELEIVDTAKEPGRAMRDGIVVTPTLVKLSPEPQWSVVGDLSDEARVLTSMRTAV